MRQSTKVKQLQLLLVSCAVILFVMVVNLLIEKIENSTEKSPEKSVWHLECIDGVNYINYKGSFSVKFNTDSTVSLCN